MKYSALAGKELNYLSRQASLFENGLVVCAGTWRGGDLMAMLSANPNNYYIVIDSFSGLSVPTLRDQTETPTMYSGMFDAKGKKAYQNSFITNNIPLPNEIHEIWIDKKSLSTTVVLDNKIDMLWLDLDLYQPTRACLEYFIPHMRSDSFILVHDYNYHVTPGVKTACDELCSNWYKVAGGIYRSDIRRAHE